MSEKHAEPLPDGTYRLTEDVVNPKPDRRIKTKRTSNWESWDVWSKGMKFIVDRDPAPNGRGMNRVYPWGAYYKAASWDRDPRTASILMHLEPVTETPSEFLARHAHGSGAGQVALAVLDKLQIPLETIQAALDALDADEAQDV